MKPYTHYLIKDLQARYNQIVEEVLSYWNMKGYDYHWIGNDLGSVDINQGEYVIDSTDLLLILEHKISNKDFEDWYYRRLVVKDFNISLYHWIVSGKKNI